jgi:hypothetical protein
VGDPFSGGEGIWGSRWMGGSHSAKLIRLFGASSGHTGSFRPRFPIFASTWGKAPKESAAIFVVKVFGQESMSSGSLKFRRLKKY